MSRVRLGDMLVAAGRLKPAEIDEALALQKQSKKRLGEILVDLGYVSEQELAQVLSNQLTIPWANLYHVDFSRELLNLVPAEVADKYGVIPVYVRRIRQQGDTLFVATDDPTNEHALVEVARHAQMPVKPMVAATSDVRNAIRVYYFGGVHPRDEKQTVQLKRATVRPPTSIPPVELDDSELDLEDDEPEVVVAAADAEAEREVKEAVVEAVAAKKKAQAEEEARATLPDIAPGGAPKKKAPRMITLTLLDGTSVRLPAPGQKAAEEPETSALTTRDLIAALTARAQGKDVSKILGDDQWESLFAALLSLLLRKGLIADWEFVDEWNKHRGAGGSS